jgi:ketosteroid isomerase-like protein
MYQAGTDGNAAGFLACLHEQIELEEPAWLPYGGTHRGLDQLQAVFVEVAKLIDLSTIKLETIIADGNQAVAVFRATLQNGEETINAEQWTIRDGKCWRGRVFYQDPTQALKTTTS